MLSTLQSSGLVALWIATFLFTATVQRDAVKRALLFAVALKATEITLYRPRVQEPLYDLFNGHLVFVGVHLVSVVAAAAVLYLLITAADLRRLWWIPAAGSFVAAATMISIYATAGPSTPTVSVPPEPLPLSYWWVLSVFHSLAHLLAVACCWRVAASRKIDVWPVRLSLVLMGLALLLSCTPWILTFEWLWTGDPAWLDPIEYIDAVTGWCLALSVAPLIAVAVRRSRTHRRTVRLLAPLWRELTALVPDLVFDARPTPGRSQYALYRRVVEIRDAMIQLRNYVSPQALRFAVDYVAERSVPVEQVQAAVTACWLAAAKDAKERGADAHAQSADLAGPGGSDVDTESQHLMQISELYFSTLADGYRQRLAAAEASW